ncbi:ComF family protein [Stieleria sp. JC731]|nr:phosphoribosyltransferase family protein [Stieleria sp. JC731]
MLGLLLPPTCRLCDSCVSEGEDFCGQCEKVFRSSEHVMQSACPVCGLPGAGAFRSRAGVFADTAKLDLTVQADPQLLNKASLPGNHADTALDPTAEGCLGCIGKSIHFDACVAMWVYHDLIRDAVIASKYGHQMALADALGRRLGNCLCRHFSDSPHEVGVPDIITAVPSHVWRRISRGAGGSRVIAMGLRDANADAWPQTKLVDCLAMTRRVRKQALLGEKERQANIRGAFRVTVPGWRSRKRPYLTGKHVLLVDDVMTTGATANEIAQTLKNAGASRVTVAVVARASS